MKNSLLLIAVMLSLPATAAAQQPRVSNGTVQPRAVTASLEQEIRGLVGQQKEPIWIGYAFPTHRSDVQMCCWNGDASSGGCCTGCRLEPGSANGISFTGRVDGAMQIEPSEVAFVLYRFEQGTISRIRTFSESCPLDAGGRTVHWLTGVRETDSVTYLASFINAPAATKTADSALSALAMHREPAALERLLVAARDGATTQIRGQALFWLAQRAGDKAVGAISDAIARDPETEVKKRAVFALSQLPKDQGVPMLIDVARKNANPVVRKQAMFWLGQSKDPRAVKFFEEILFK
jgi:hypothetical protein